MRSRFLDSYLWLQFLKVWLKVVEVALILTLARLLAVVTTVANYVLPSAVLDWARRRFGRRRRPAEQEPSRAGNKRRGGEDGEEGKKGGRYIPETEMTTPELITSRGYPCEEHFVRTEDGFVLGLHRIPFGRDHFAPADSTSGSSNDEDDDADEGKREDEACDLRRRRNRDATAMPTKAVGAAVSSKSVTKPSHGTTLYHRQVPHDLPLLHRQQSTRRPAVYIMHGFLQSSECFVSTDNNLPFMLADAGFDVWLGNCRGNKYSCKHERLSPDSYEYWDFCIDDVALFDIPAALQYVLDTTKNETLGYVGFSQGTCVAFAAFSANHELSKRVNMFVAMAPAIQLKGFSNTLVDALTRCSPDVVYLILGKKRLLPMTLFWKDRMSASMFNHTIDKSVEFLFGWDSANIHEEDKTYHYSHIYSYSSVKSVVHWFQLMNAHRFQRYDDHRWHTDNTGYLLPAYPVHQIRCPIAIFHGGRDFLQDTEQLIRQLPKDIFIDCEPTYEHMDFMYSRKSLKSVYPKIVSLLQQAIRDPSVLRDAETNGAKFFRSHTPEAFKLTKNDVAGFGSSIS
eukprot:TRINITY_DN52398_c0_g1_i1.p2 TRINITY_DN52398_c0_g1~~TRINITY_DN52398_c0_g1_i1.p2  ORF type:complete len:567 (-),score=287.74 TRINITY_DN52398_c0_g1_i1:25-1725(-)